MNADPPAGKPWSNATGLKVGCLLVVAALLFGSLLLPSVGSHPGGSRNTCMNNMRQIAVALVTYQELTGRFRPAYVTDANGKPLYSWRVLITPYLERGDILREYALDEPWNSPKNIRFADQMPEVFRCVSSKKDGPFTNYVAVTGPETVWPGAVGTALADVTDSPAQTLLLVEIADSDINWMEPRDLTFQQASRGINPPNLKPAPSSPHPGGINAAFIDAHLRFLGDDTPPDVLRALLTKAGGEKIDENQY